LSVVRDTKRGSAISCYSPFNRAVTVSVTL
jgi:hypothetical protein